MNGNLNQQHQVPGRPEEQARPPGPFDKEPIKVSLGVYLTSLLVVGLGIFILMLALYLPGHQNYARIRSAVEHANSVNMEVVVYGEDLPKDSSFSPNKEKKKLTDVIKGMGAKNVDVVVEQISREKHEQEKKRDTTPGESNKEKGQQ